jgi:protein-S-isoprenylcysteine O-methyltransferase Ste14
LTKVKCFDSITLITIRGIKMDGIDVFVILSLAIFYALFIGRTVLLCAKGVKVWAIGTSAGKPLEKLLEIMLFPALLLWTVCVVVAALPITAPALLSTHLIKIGWIKYIGILFCYSGLAIFLLALISFGKAWRIGIDEKNSPELITGGIFRHSRNPIFLFMDLYFTGILLIYPNIVFVIMAVGAAIGIHLQILREEQFLQSKFGEAYREYKKRTRRYV